MTAQTGLAALLLAVVMPLLAGPAPAGDGLRGVYYDQNGQQRQYFTGGTYQRIDPTVDFDWATGNPAPGIGANDFSVRWSGLLLADHNGQNTQCYRFQTWSDDGVRLYLDLNLDGDFNDANETLIDNWTDHSAAFDQSGCRNLTDGVMYPIRLEFYERGGDARIRLYWDPPGGGNNNYSIIPQSNLFSGITPEIVSVETAATSGAVCGDLSVLTVTYNTPMSSTGNGAADRRQNYNIPGGPGIDDADLSGDGLTVTLTLDAPLTQGTSYTLEAYGVESGNGIPVNPDPYAFNFTPTSGTLTPGGLEGTYYDQNGTTGAYFTGTTNTRIDGPIAFNAGNDSFWPGTVPADQFSVRWEGYIKPSTSDYYYFTTSTDDGVRLWIDGDLAIDNWTDHSSTQDDSGYYLLYSDTYYRIRLEYYENGGQAEMQLGWNGYFSGINGIIPAANQYTCQSANQPAGFQISVSPTNASTCAPVTVGVTALLDDGSINTNYTGTVALSTSSAHGTWTLNMGGGGFTDATPDDGAAGYTYVTGDSGVASFLLSNVHADDLIIRAEETGRPASLSTSVQVSFRDNAFVVTENDALDNIPVAGRPHSYQIRQIRRDSGGQCGVNTNYQGNIGLKAWIGRDAADPGGAAPTIGGAPLPGATPGANNLSLNFTGGTANFTLGTTDVGKYGINFTDDTSGFAVDASNNPRPISGGTTAIQTVRPFGFTFSGVPFDVGSGGADFRRAGELFNLGVSAVQWQAADDADGNGIPDGHGQADNNRTNDANLADNAVTPAYAWTTTLQAARPTGPAAGALGVLNGGPVAAGSFAGGSASQGGMQYLEAGEVSVYAELQNYLGTGGANTHSLSPLIGRFVPQYYDVAVTRQGCFVGGFTYAEQPVDEITVTARNINGATTANYTGAWSRDITLTETSPAGTLSGGTAGGGQFAGGVLTLNDQVSFALADPETAPLSVDLAVTADERATPAPGNGAAGTVNIRSGRVMLDDAVGSELLPLDLPLRIEYYADSNTGWTTHTADSCTTTADLGFAISNDTAGTSISGSSLSNASGSVTLAAPGSTGHADITVSGPAWLQSDRDGIDQGSDGDLSDDDDQARGTFGVYEGDDNLIYQREQY